MKKLLIFFLMAISTSLFAEEIILTDLYAFIPIEDEDTEWRVDFGDRFIQLTDDVQADLSGRTVVIQFHESVNEVWINVVDQFDGTTIVEEYYTSPFVITLNLNTALPGEYMLEIYTGENAYGAKFELE